jgi:glycosyltransferase involved in cell wall biosynthesis
MSDNSALRILQVCSAREAIYGAALSLLTLAEAQREAGHQVDFATFVGKRFGSQVRARGFVNREFNVRAKLDIFAALKMRRYILDRRIDLVHTHLSTSSVNGGLAARLARVPALSTVHGLSGRLSFKFSDHLIAVSEQVKNHMVQQRIPSSQVSVVYNGLNLKDFHADSDASRLVLGLAEFGPVIGTVSRITALKGVEDGVRVIRVLKEHFPNLIFLVVGDGDALDSVRAVTEDLGLSNHVRFVGYQTDIRPYLAAMDLFLFPSHKEAMGVALVEAMASGLASVATRVGGIPEVVTPDVGVLCPAHDVPGLAEAALSLLKDSSRRVEMGAKAKLRAEKVFSSEAMQLNTERVYRHVLQRGPQSRVAKPLSRV